MRRSGEGEDASAGSKVGVVDPGRNFKVLGADLSQSKGSQSTKEMRLKQKQDRADGPWRAGAFVQIRSGL